MANDTIITVVGNLVADPELRFQPSGSAVANFTIASTPSTFNKQTNEWEDGEPIFLRSSIWREAAENVAETLTKGMRVIAQGKLKMRSFDDKATGQRRTVTELEILEIGPSLKYLSGNMTRTQRSGGGQGGNQNAQQGGAQADPWATPQQGAPQQGAPMQQPMQGGQQYPQQGMPPQQGGQQYPQQGAPVQQQPQQNGGWNNPQQDNQPPF